MADVLSSSLVKHYEAAPVVARNRNTELVDPDNQLSTGKEEEWVTKKKVELTTKKQIETRVKRHVVLEDGKVVDDSGPIVTTNTTEDTEKQEHQHTEHRTHGDDDPPSASASDEGWVAVPGPGGTIREVKERKVKSHEEKQELLETEAVHHLGDFTDEGYLGAVRENKDVRQALLSGQELVRDSDGRLVVVGDSRSSEPRIVHQSSKGRKVVDTEDTHEVSEVQPDGRVVTERKRTTEHEEIDEKEDPDDGQLKEEDKHRESSHRFRKSRDQELVEYLADGVKIGQEMRYQCDNVEGERFGQPGALDIEDQQDWDSLSTRIRRMRRNKLLQGRAATGQITAGPGQPDRKDALTRRPLDFDQEEETRKVETSKWLEHHFGSESRSSKDSIEDEDDVQKGTTTSFINVTMKSRPVASTPKSNGFASPSRVNGLSSSRVFVSSPEPDSPGYFQGISEWSERRNESRDSAYNKKSTFSPSDPTSAAVGAYTGRPDRVQVLPSGPDHTFKSGSRLYKTTSTHLVGADGDRSSPYRHDSDENLHEKVGRREFTHHVNTAYLDRDRSDRLAKSPSPPLRNKYAPKRYDEEDDDVYRVSKKESFRGWDRRDREPAPDYAPPSPSPSPPPPANKKLYQRTRFAADIPPPSSRSAPTTIVKTQQQSASQIIGDSFRKLVGKFRSSSSERKKEKAARKLSGKSRGSSRSPSPTYRAADGSLLGRSKKKPLQSRRSHRGPDGDGSSPNEETEGGESPEELHPIAPPRNSARNGKFRERERSTLSRSDRRGGSNSAQESSDRDVVDGEHRTTRKYYLGEDPFGGSIYGREKEYDGVVPARRKQRPRRGSQSEEEQHSSTLGRLSKSTSRLSTSGTTQQNTLLNGATGRRTEYYNGRGGSQTLPRKLREKEETIVRPKKQVYVTRSNVERSSPHQQVWETRFSREPRSSLTSPHTGSLINVSFVNQVTPPASSIGISRPSNGVTWDREGPAKPARTYRTSLTRSKSFNVQAGPATYVTPAKSNSHLHRLEESPPPLKSPGILASISRSQRDLSEAIDKENVDDLYTKPRKTERRAFSGTNQLNNGIHHDRSQQEKKKVFLRGLLDRAPELFKTLHPEEESRTPARTGKVNVIDYSNSFRSNNTGTPPPRSPFRAGADRSSPSGGAGAPKSVLSSRMAHTPSFRRESINGNGVHTTIVRRGSGSRDSDDFSETVHITSKSNDPLRPSVTDTVQSYSKKTLPSSSGRGRKETIETSETSKVTKSRYRGGSGDSGVDTSSSSGVHSRFILDSDAKYHSKYPKRDRYATNNGGVVIEVRNTRK